MQFFVELGFMIKECTIFCNMLHVNSDQSGHSAVLVGGLGLIPWAPPLPFGPNSVSMTKTN